MKFIFYFIFLIILSPIFLIGSIKTIDTYHNEIKYHLNGYTKINYDKDGNRLKYNDVKIDNFIFIALNDYIRVKEGSKQYPEYYKNNITEQYLVCFTKDISVDVGCMYNIYDKNIPILINDKCQWIYYGYETAVKFENYFLINHPERMCGSMSFRMHNHYLIDYDGKIITLIDKVLANKGSLQGKVNFYKIKNNGISYTEKSCRGHVEQNCWGLRDEVMFFSFTDVL